MKKLRLKKEVLGFNHANHYEMASPHSKKVTAHCRVHSEIKRNIIWVGEDSADKSDRRKLAKELSLKLRGFIHPRIYAYIPGRSGEDCIIEVIKERICRGAFMLKVDLERAFLKVDVVRLKSILLNALMKHGGMSRQKVHDYLEKIFVHFNFSNRKPISFRGLPQGDNLSPILFAVYLTPLMKEFDHRMKCQQTHPG